MNHHAATSTRTTRRASAGMTVLEMMIVLAVVGGMVFIVRSGYRLLIKADLVENSSELAAVMRRAGQLAIEHGELHRVVLNFDNQDPEKPDYLVEVCQGQAAIMRNERLNNDDDETKRAIERGKQRLNGLPSDALAAGDPEEATKRAIALSGHHIADRTCHTATDSITGDATGKDWTRKLRKAKGIKLKEVWVQHRDDAVTKGQVAVYFFPQGGAEKSIIELTDGNEVFSVLVFGLTGRVELRDGALRDVNDHMLKNVMGDKEAKREDQP
jgi:type II secretory pathway pseudopilin PulG